MGEQKKVLAVIPARSGSKGLKDKNIKDLCGKPMMVYSIEAALKSGIFDTIHVSTDSEKYKNIALDYGADVPFLREETLSTDFANSWDVVRFVVSEYEKRGKNFDIIVLLQPTSPLRTAENIIDAYDMMMERHAKAVISVCEPDHSPLWADTISSDGNMKGFIKREYRGIPRQALPLYYIVNGAIYIIRRDILNADMSDIYDNECYAYVMSRENSVDIDNELDYRMASFMIQYRGMEK